MATAPPPALPPGLVPSRFTDEQFEKMIEAGIFPEGVHAELLDGIVVTMVKGDPHNLAVGETGDALRRILPPGWFVSEEKSLRIGRGWRPEPDVAVLRGHRRDYTGRIAPAGSIALVVEVSDSSYDRDRGVKWPKYAEIRVSTYWILNLNESRVEVYTDPAGRGASASYTAAATFQGGDSIPVVIEGREVGRVAVADILP
jgi:Uma2 family endonuclease